MSNLVKASVIFCFKGESHSPSIMIELDEYLGSGLSIPNLHPMIAEANNHDLYSYEYEMMQAEQILFSEATGLVSEFITDGMLDVQGFEQAWKDNLCLEQLVVIAKDKLAIDDLEKQPDLKQALLDAYNLGRSSSDKVSAQK